MPIEVGYARIQHSSWLTRDPYKQNQLQKGCDAERADWMDRGTILRCAPVDYAHGEQGQLGQKCRQDTQGAIRCSQAAARATQVRGERLRSSSSMGSR